MYEQANRPRWDEVWLQVAHAVAQRSLCDRARVGAVIVSKDNRVQAASYNGPAPGFAHGNMTCSTWCQRSTAIKLSPTYDDCPASHAEANAIARSDWSQLHGAAIYVTAATCYPCAKLIAQTGIRTLVHVVRPEDMHRDPERVEDYLASVGITTYRVLPPDVR